MAYLLKCMSRALHTSSRALSRTNASIVYSNEVLQAKSEGKPIVALESTIITHGMPYPHNLATAVAVENIIRERGATPATVAILKGLITVGLSEEQLQYLAQAKDVVKASRRDLAVITAAKLDGATTVAGTIVAAELAGIPVFVTGGIGGVHREGERTLDVSADLNELGRSRTLVVCSGVKSILDIGRTLEYLETQGVCVCSFGETSDFPAFYTPRSGHRAPHHVTTAEQAALILHSARLLNLQSGIVIAVPVPEEHAMNEKEIDNAINVALNEAKTKGITGKEVTPYILAAVAEVTGGASLNTNIALIKNNARVGADIAVQHKKLEKDGSSGKILNVQISKDAGKCSFRNPSRKFHSFCIVRDKIAASENGFARVAQTANLKHDVLVIGGSNVDKIYKVHEDTIKLDGSTHACSTEECAGGVGRNMAEALWRMTGGRARLLTAVGDDAEGHLVRNIAPSLMLDGCTVSGGRTSTYATVVDARGECRLGLGDMALHEHISVDLVKRHLGVLEKSPIVVMDGNVPQETIDFVVNICHDLKKPVFFEPTDRRKATKAFRMGRPITYATPNINELRAIANSIDNCPVQNCTETEELLQLCKIVHKMIEVIIVTLGSKGVLVYCKRKSSSEGILYPVRNKIQNIENVSGAGDCFASGFLFGTLANLKVSDCVHLGFEAARCALQSKSPVPTTFLR